MNHSLTQAYYFGRQAYGTHQRCPYATAEMVAEWNKGRADAKRANKDLRPMWRRKRRAA